MFFNLFYISISLQKDQNQNQNQILDCFKFAALRFLCIFFRFAGKDSYLIHENSLTAQDVSIKILNDFDIIETICIPIDYEIELEHVLLFR